MTAQLSETFFLPPGAPRPPFHPFAALFPMMRAEEQAELAASIRDKGQLQPVVLHRGFVLDGRNRIEACAAAGVGVQCRHFIGSDRAALDYVIALNLDRRHLTPSQRAMVAAKLATLRVGDNQHSGAPVGQGQLELGSAGVPPASIQASGRAGGTPAVLETAPGAPAQNCAGDTGEALYEPDPEIMAQVEERGQHIVAMTIDGDVSVGTCRCGMVFRAARDGASPAENVARANEMTRAIEAHWRESLGLSGISDQESVIRQGSAADARPPDALVSQEQAAAMMSVSRRSLQHAAVVHERAAPEVRDAVTAGEIAVSTAAEIAAAPAERQAEMLAALRGPDGKLTPEGRKAVAKAARELRADKQEEKKKRRAEREAELAGRQLAMPDLAFGVVLEDFEWDFEVRSRETGMDRHAANHYEVAADAHTPEEIVERTRARFVAAADDCVLYMWAPNPHLAIALDVMKLRGFAYVTNYAWGKDKIGPGYWNREKHELLLVGRRGKVVPPAMGEQYESLQIAPRREHSRKPEWVYEMIERHFPNVPKLELNARHARPGWHVWGNEAPASARDNDGSASQDDSGQTPASRLECKWCQLGNPRIPSSVSDAFIHNTSIGRVICLEPGAETGAVASQALRAGVASEDGGRQPQADGVMLAVEAAPAGAAASLALCESAAAPTLPAAGNPNAHPPQRVKQAEVNFGMVGIHPRRNCARCAAFVLPCACQRVVGIIEHNGTKTICDLFAAASATAEAAE